MNLIWVKAPATAAMADDLSGDSGDHVMATDRRFALMTSLTSAFAIAALVVTANAQPSGPGPRGRMGSDMDRNMMMGPGPMHRGMMGRMCGPGAAGFAEWRINRLEQAIKPTEAQRAKFDEYKAASNKAAEIMRSACPTEIPLTVTGRMEAMEKRMDAMLQAVKTVRPALEALYATLTDDQKATINSTTGRRHRDRFWRWRDRW